MTNFEVASRIERLDRSKVGRAIRFYREAKEVTLDALAKKLDKSRQTISRYENGQVRLCNKLSFLRDVAGALDVSLSRILKKAEEY